MFEGGGIWFALEARRQIVPGLSAQRDEAAEPEFRRKDLTLRRTEKVLRGAVAVDTS